MLNLKNIGVILLASIFLLFSCKEEDKSTFKIEGKLSNLNAPYFFLVMESPDSLIVDTIRIDEHGVFSHEGKVDTLTIASLYFDKKAWSTSVFLDKGWDVNIDGNINYSDLITVNGGNVNDDLTAFKKENEQLLKIRTELLLKIKDAANVDMFQNYNAELKNIEFDLINKAKSYVEKNPDKVASVILIQDFLKSNISLSDLDKLLGSLEGAAVDFPLTQDLKKQNTRTRLSQVGAIAPDFTLKNGEKEFDLRKYKGKYIYLTFVAQDGEVYKERIPYMIDAYKKLKNKDTEFISIVIDYKDENTPDSIKWPVFYDNKGWASQAVNLYNISELPYGILISPKGWILERGILAPELSEKIQDLQKDKK
ncbi:DUF4369 domain-containing protein [Dysgonomonas sp. 216]|uniref:DUF4369 domain-containing protein n=1 Tax=Dysgonomonas sp. 216 TaxID=2302934 RepID=UPI0013D322CD|nr:DUF4369 domain-containing protein [Dysgonomonas sp. 216]NDW17505.1 DUF4369 domain-containing protein [Dysgonomonas sp. 216]